jgi:hypothetical protein
LQFIDIDRMVSPGFSADICFNNPFAGRQVGYGLLDVISVGGRPDFGHETPQIDIGIIGTTISWGFGVY